MSHEVPPCIRIQLLSDLHLEFERSTQESSDQYKYDFPAKAEILALLGDVGETTDERLFEWLNGQLARFKVVFFLSGNNEPNGSTIEESRKRLSQFSGECHARALRDPTLGRFVLLDRTRYDLSPTVTVLGCTLWARLNTEMLDFLSGSLSDFKRIVNFDVAAYQAQHAADLAFLEEAIDKIVREEPHRKIVVMTHHAPTIEGTSNPKFAGGATASAFATELVGGPCWREQVKVWMFGHTHWSCDFEREGVRVVSNQRGYRDADTNFVLDKVIEV